MTLWNPLALVTWLVSLLGGPAAVAPPAQAIAAAPPAISAPAPDPSQQLSDGFDPERAPFVVRLGDAVVGYGVLGVPVLPGARLPLVVRGAGGPVEVGTHGGALATESDTSWTWTAPAEPGLYPIALRSAAHREAVTLNVFVVHPWHPGVNIVDGYVIGRYPHVAASSKHADRYAPPIGFIRVDEADAATPVSPHFTLGQFACKQGGAEWPKFVALQPALFVKLETALEAVNRHGIEAPTFQVMSGFRTRVYNAGLGNVNLSRHTFGDASDIFVDVHPLDGRMDDLNHDGREDERDAAYLRQIIEVSAEQTPYAPVAAGIGIYGSTLAHGPFVHVDARGFRARWEG
jgi:hypothetical protein